MVLTEGGPLVPYTFDGLSGTVSGTVTSGFNLGALNTIEGIVNNTHSGVLGPLQGISAGQSNDGTHFGMDGFVSYVVVPEPSCFALAGLGAAALMVLRQRR